jgi:hypothetical protein
LIGEFDRALERRAVDDVGSIHRLVAGADAVIIVSNRAVTADVVRGFARRGVPGFGPIVRAGGDTDWAEKPRHRKADANRRV